MKMSKSVDQEQKSTAINLYGIDTLCFDKNDFMQKNFNVDAFVHMHQASGSGGLEVLRDDLGVYLKILRSAMIDLINRDYADFVNLSTNLTGLDRYIDALKTPLGQLREEVLSVEQLLSEAITSVSSDLSRRHTINQQKALLHRINQISIRLDRLEALMNSRNSETATLGEADPNDNSANDLIDRLATEVNHLNFLVGQCEGTSLLNSFKPKVERVCSFVEVGLQRRLKEGILGGDKQLLLRTLRTYASLGTIDHAQQQVRTILKDNLEEVISDSALKSDPRGLQGMYDKVLDVVRKVCDPLLAVSLGTGSDVVPGYSFLECSAWPEIVSALDLRTQPIFNAGNPSTFHERYKQSMEFLTSFENLMQSQERIQAFRNGKDFNWFLDLWNLPVYFQIRYQEIGQVMESGLSDSNHGLTFCVVKKEFKLSSSQIVWESLLKCFHADIFLLPLLHRFWKLVLLLLSRHRTFISETTRDLQNRLWSSSKSAKTAATQPQANGGGASKDGASWDAEAIRVAVYLVKDIETLSSRIDQYFDTAMRHHLEHLPEDKKDLIKDTLHEQRTKHVSQKAGLERTICDHMIACLSAHLKQVSDTPRIYRRTNKPLPTSHQAYVGNVFTSLAAFYAICEPEMKPEELKAMLETVFVSVATQYRALTYEVLSSVHKMEESLRRLKRARDRGVQSGSNPSTGASDDDKIRSQIHLDVLYFGKQISSFGVAASEMKSYSELVDMVVSAKDGKFHVQ